MVLNQANNVTCNEVTKCCKFRWRVNNGKLAVVGMYSSLEICFTKIIRRFLLHPAESSQNTCDFWEIRKYCPKFYNGRLWENFFFSFWSVWDKLVIVPSFWWYIILSHSNEIRTTWRYSNKYVYLKFFTSVTFAQNKIIKISPRSSDLITMRKNNIPPKTWYNYQFVPDTSKTEKKNFLIDAHYKTLGSIFWHLKKWKYFLNFPQGVWIRQAYWILYFTPF